MEVKTMYFPYLRGRQYELLALRELATNHLLGDYVTPIVEPVKLSPTLVNTMADFIKVNHSIAIIRNPAVGTFMSDWQDVQDETKEAVYKQRFTEQYENPAIIKSLIMQRNAKSLLAFWDKKGINKSELLVINTDRDYLNLYETTFGTIVPRFALMPDESVFRRKIRHHKVLLDDKFEKQERNADYQDEDDEFFSDDHLYYKEDALDYLPTQYISDYIRSKGYDGIEYGSTMRKQGFNLAVFDPTLFKCTSTKVYDVKSISYDYKPI